MRAALVVAFLCGCGGNGHFMDPCNNAGCTTDASAAGKVLCKSSCADGFACYSEVLATAGRCFKTCSTNADCTGNHYPEPPDCSTMLDVNELAPRGWCVDLPVVTQ